LLLLSLLLPLLLSASLRLLLTTFCHNNPHLTRTLLPRAGCRIFAELLGLY